MRLFWPKINQVILLIVVAEFILLTAFGTLAPIMAIFVTEQINNGTVAVMGFAITIYWAIKSVLQLFVARFIDRNQGEIDDYYFFIAGVLANSILVSLYFFATEIWHIYTLHFLIGVADAALVPPFYAIFTRHIDKDHEGFEWSLFSSFSLGAGSALGGLFGGIIATVGGTRIVFLIAGVLTFLAGITLVFLRPYIKPRALQEITRIPVEQKKI